MKSRFRSIAVLSVAVVIGGLAYVGCGQADKSASATAKDAKAEKKVQRYGCVIGLKPEKKDEYVKLHADTWPSVLKQIKDSNIQNYSIYMGKLDDGNLYLFAYFEYTGDDFEADMAEMAKDPETQRWWKLTDPCQIPQKNRAKPTDNWMIMEEVFHTD
ncbi:MAG: L-rhamnose mutarotase [Pirellulales bacterium]|nr:L-rhamnose mutarotase [Pirellulales bacterium]